MRVNTSLEKQLRHQRASILALQQREDSKLLKSVDIDNQNCFYETKDGQEKEECRAQENLSPNSRALDSLIGKIEALIQQGKDSLKKETESTDMTNLLSPISQSKDRTRFVDLRTPGSPHIYGQIS